MSIGINCQTENVLTVAQTETDISGRTGFSKFQLKLFFFFPDSTVYKTVSQSCLREFLKASLKKYFKKVIYE